jgi:hypothetical protein
MNMKMKKILFFLAVAAVALASCSSDDTIAENSKVGNNQQKEITFQAVATPVTRSGAVSAGVFPTGYNFYIAAYSGGSGDYFTAKEFANESGTIWSGKTASDKVYWPIGPATLNFLAVTKPITAGGSPTVTFDSSHPASEVVVVIDDNTPTTSGTPGVQHDLMYSFARATVAQNGSNGLTYTGVTTSTTNVAMQFHHAFAWVTFKIHSNVAGLTLTNITLNDAIYAGTYTVTLNNYDKADNTSVTTDDLSVNARWTTVANPTASNSDVAVPGWTADTSIPTSATEVGDGLLVVPNPNVESSTQQPSFTNFTINFKQNGNAYSFTYNPTLAQRQLDPGKKYVFDITLTLTEIKVDASVVTWGTTSDNSVSIPQ